MKGFEFRGIEFHNSRMWQLAQVERALDFMEKTGMNALVFHQNDLIDQLVFPLKYFSDELMWKRWPVRMHTIYNNRHYINKVIREAKEKGIDFYPEVKEIHVVDALFEIKPELRNADGSICPTDPFWPKFMEEKVTELLEAVPDIAGIVVSVGTRESRISISTNTCICQRCKETKPLEWYYQVINAMYRPLAAKNKKLVVRDFSYSAEHQGLMLEAASMCSKDVVMCLKNTPHDFYPTFPTNPKIGHTGEHPAWAEYDVWGQFYGMGFFPVGVVEDIQRRLRECREKKITGVLYRTDWEVINESSVFNSPNLLNLFAGAALAKDVDTDLDDIYRLWGQEGFISPMISGSYIPEPVKPENRKAYLNLKQFMKASWRVMEKASYVRGHVFLEDDQTPDTVEKAFDMMIRIHGRDDWEPGASKLVEVTEENIKIIFAEKEQALQEVKELPDILKANELGIDEKTEKELQETLELYVYYVDACRLSTFVCYLTKQAQITKKEEDIRKAKDSAALLSELRDSIIKRLEGTHYPHYVYWLLDQRRLHLLIEDAQKQLSGL